MRVALVGAELEENLALRYMASALESKGHEVDIVPFNTEEDVPTAVSQTQRFQPQMVGLSMIFTGRAREFCHLAGALRESGYKATLLPAGTLLLSIASGC